VTITQTNTSPGQDQAPSAEVVEMASDKATLSPKQVPGSASSEKLKSAAVTTSKQKSRAVQEIPITFSSFHVKRRTQAKEEDLRKQLAEAPSVKLDAVRVVSTTLLKRAKASWRKKDREQGQLIQEVIQNREDLAGLPWRLGKECRMDSKAAKLLEVRARQLREALAVEGRATREFQKKGSEPTWGFTAVRYSLMHSLGYRTWQNPQALSVLQQILMSENTELRSYLVEMLASNTDKNASVALAQRALFDLDPDLRKSALWALRGRPARDVYPVLLDGLRYPWAPVADHAAEALVSLQAKDSVPDLIKFLAEQDPALPFQEKVNGRSVFVVRELVQVNHLRNCLLCHAPSLAREDRVRGLVPDPGRPLPPISSPVYYSSRSGTFIRADVTYLRQDFAVLQTVNNPGKWPKLQRHDYLVRVRPATDDEKDTYKERKTMGERQPLCDQHKAVLFALRELTGKNLGFSAKQWQRLHWRKVATNNPLRRRMNYPPTRVRD
jgi:hypothetical protein